MKSMYFKLSQTKCSEMKRILIIGGYGFLGQHIVHYLVKRDKTDEITVLDLIENKLIYPDDFKDVKTITEVNIVNLGDMKKHIVGFEIVYLIAASIKYGRRNVEILNLVNVIGSENVRISCEQNNVKKLKMRFSRDLLCSLFL